MTRRSQVGWLCGIVVAALIAGVPRLAAAFFGVEDCLNGGVHSTELEPPLPGCWFLGAAGESCADVCRNHGLVYDEQTRTVVGSGPGSTPEACDLVLGLLGHPGMNADPPCAAGLGCYYDTETMQNMLCASPPTTAEAAAANAERACACMPGATAPALSRSGLCLAMLALLGAGLWALRRRAPAA
jgi:hypothetical protein